MLVQKKDISEDGRKNDGSEENNSVTCQCLDGEKSRSKTKIVDRIHPAWQVERAMANKRAWTGKLCKQSKKKPRDGRANEKRNVIENIREMAKGTSRTRECEDNHDEEGDGQRKGKVKVSQPHSLQYYE